MTTAFTKGHRRIVVTGLGAVTPLGLDVATSWNALIEGRSGIGMPSPKNYAGRIAVGKTRSKKKYSNKFILSRRSKTSGLPCTQTLRKYECGFCLDTGAHSPIR